MIEPQMKCETLVLFVGGEFHTARRLMLLHEDELTKGNYYLVQHWKPQHNDWKALVVGEACTPEGLEELQRALDDQIIPKDVLGFGLSNVKGHAIWEFDGCRMVLPD